MISLIIPYPKSLDRNSFNFDNIYKLSLQDGCATMAKNNCQWVYLEALKLLPKKPSSNINLLQVAEEKIT